MSNWMFGYFTSRDTYNNTEIPARSISFIEETGEIMVKGNSFGSAGGVTRQEMEDYVNELIIEALNTAV